MIDDLVTLGVDEPYRMFTSRAEYRLILREDNALLRLAGKGHELGLIPDDAHERFQERLRCIRDGLERLSANRIYPVDDVNRTLREIGTPPIRNPVTLFQLLKREEVAYDDLKPFAGWAPIADRAVKKQIEIEAKYEGYIKRQREAVRKMKALEAAKIPVGIDYDAIPSLSNELKMKLARIEPSTIGQAQRIPGMTQSALTAILIFIKKMELPAQRQSRSITATDTI
jgi:tRNA uridine 5-carboxymethylaminomethyl modification enzyme